MKPSDASVKRAREWWNKTLANDAGEEDQKALESLAALLDTVRDEALEEAASMMSTFPGASEAGQQRIRALKVKAK